MALQECAVVVLGGGVSGLTAKFTLKQLSSLPVTLIESSNRYGGWIRSEILHGHLFERGPHTLRLTDEKFKQFLIDDLNLGSEITSVKSTRILIMHNQKIRALTSVPLKKPFLYYPLHNAFSFRRNLFPNDVSVQHFIEKLFDSSVADNLVDPLFRGIFGSSSIDKLSAESCLSEAFKTQNLYGSFVRRMMIQKLQKQTPSSNVVYLKNGMEKIVNSLVDQSDNLFLNETCYSLEYEDATWTIHTNLRSIRASHLISAIPAFTLSSIIPATLNDLKAMLSSIRFSSLGLVQFLFKENASDVQRHVPANAFGYLLPSREHESVLGVLFDSNMYGTIDDDTIKISVFIDYSRIDFQTEAELVDYVLHEIRKQIPIVTKPLCSLVTLAENCAPIYAVGHKKLCENIENFIVNHRIPLTLVGASYGTVGIPSLIKHSQEKARKCLVNLNSN